jgi:GNAT superfamily N-acetyltransferase
VRTAEVDDFAALESIENRADAPLIDFLHASTWWPAASAADRVRASGFVLVAVGDTDGHTVGFVHVLEEYSIAHLEQLSVLPEFGRHGYGRRLVLAAAEEARRLGHSQLTLRTYADVPWNAPFYSTCGFVETLPDTEFHRSLVATEDELGLPAYGRRVQMTLNLQAG